MTWHFPWNKSMTIASTNETAQKRISHKSYLFLLDISERLNTIYSLRRALWSLRGTFAHHRWRQLRVIEACLSYKLIAISHIRIWDKRILYEFNDPDGCCIRGNECLLVVYCFDLKNAPMLIIGSYWLSIKKFICLSSYQFY